ncbi:MAG: DUF4381 domain-containing protein [Xanthomonadales bacterium]
MNADPSPLLDQLQDIHAVGSPLWWPPAIGWWVLALLLLFLMVAAIRLLRVKLAARKRRREWLRALDAIGQELDPQRDAQQYLAGLNRLFRAVALKAFPGTACAGLQGEEWVIFISSHLPEDADDSSLAALARGPYEPVPNFDAQPLAAHARTWVRLYG